MKAARRALATNASSTGATAGWSCGERRKAGSTAPPLRSTAAVIAARCGGGIEGTASRRARVPEASPVVSAVPRIAIPSAEPTCLEVLWIPDPSPDWERGTSARMRLVSCAVAKPTPIP